MASLARFTWVSATAHVLVGAAVVVLPILWPSELPPAEGMRVTLLNPAPPPPPPLAWGSPDAKRTHGRATRQVIRKKKRAQTSEPQEPSPVHAQEATAASAPPQTPAPAADERAGSLDGTLDGSQQGVIDGVDGGVVGGVRDGKQGGTLWATGDEVVAYDVPPRALRQPRPVYSAEAAVKRVEGTVVVDLLIDRDGKVARAQVVESVPLLDQEALRTVYTWRFAPARRAGVAVPAVARADVKFTLL